MGKEADTISSYARSCVEQYHVLAKYVSQALQDDGFYELWKARDLDESRQRNETHATIKERQDLIFERAPPDILIQDQLGRFNLWTSSVGVFAPLNQSFDYRLREALDEKRMILKLLRSHLLACQKIKRLFAEMYAEHTQIDAPDHGHGGVFSATTEAAGTIREAIWNLAENISRLHRLSNAVQKAGISSSNSRARSHVFKDAEGNDIGSLWREQAALRLIHSKYPLLSEGLVNRLADAMLLRRQRIDSHRPRSENLIMERLDNDSSGIGLLQIFPHPPTPAASGIREAQCPYCGFAIPLEEIAEVRLWREHVLTDIAPYVCLFEPCSQPDRLFHDERDWLSHMRSEHRTKWRCSAKSHSKKALPVFDTKIECENHFKDVHTGAFTESRLSMVVERCAIASGPIFEICPMFGPSCDEQTLRDLAEEIEPSLSPLERHVMSHLRYLALKSLPQEDVGVRDTDTNSYSTPAPISDEEPWPREIFINFPTDSALSHLRHESVIEIPEDPGSPEPTALTGQADKLPDEVMPTASTGQSSGITATVGRNTDTDELPSTVAMTPTNPFLRFYHNTDSKDSKTRDETHNFENSVGVEYRTFGSLHCWEAEGAVRQKFLVLKDSIKDYLVKHGDAVSAPVIWQVYMIGRSKKSARPVILFCSKDANARKTIRRKIEDSNILASFSGFTTGDCTRPLEFDQLKSLAADDMEVSRPSEMQDVRCDNPIGRQIQVQGTLVQYKSATIGVVFDWDGVLLFMTAAHAFFDDGLMSTFDDDDGNDFELSFDEGNLGAGHEEAWEYSNKGKIAHGTHRERESLGAARSTTTLRRYPETVHSEPSEALPAFTYTMEDVVFSSKDGPEPSLDYCLVILKEGQSEGRGTSALTESDCNCQVVQPRKRTNPAPLSGPVVVYTRSAYAKYGMLSAISTFMTLPGGKKTQELWYLKLHDTLSEGDCGSIVINRKTGNIEGHIVAGCPGSENAYIIPAYGVFKDIRGRFSSRLKVWNRFTHYSPPPIVSISRREAAALTRTFRENLSESRKANLSKKWQVSSRTGQPRSHTIHNIPIIPHPPQTDSSIKFRDQLRSLSEKSFQWHSRDLLDEVRSQVPLQRLHSQAEEEYRSTDNVYSRVKPPVLGFQDCLIKALLTWFKRSFFEWLEKPSCTRCGNETTMIDTAGLKEEDLAGGATVVEVYECKNRSCGNFLRFPRYTNPFVLMRTRKGKYAEWASCFTMLCQAVGLRVRWVWNAEDRYWTEVYSMHQRRWIHVDATAEAWDQPQMYCEEWGHTLSYCIAFSKDGATDVTRRYVRSQRFARDRRRASEAELLYILGDIRAVNRKDMSADQQERLMLEDKAEQDELQNLVLDEVLQDFCRIDVTVAGFPPTR